MCGIVGYIGKEQAAPIILDGLSKLEYRGYDSAGMAVYDGERIRLQKAIGRLKILENLTRGGREAAASATPDGPPTARPAITTPILTPIRRAVSRWCITVLLRIIFH